MWRPAKAGRWVAAVLTVLLGTGDGEGLPLCHGRWFVGVLQRCLSRVVPCA
jgi:hypothetical protein